MGLRLVSSITATFLMWIWWKFAIDSTSAGNLNISIGKKVMAFYFTGPLLYRISLMALPSFSWIKLDAGLLVFIVSLYV